MAHQFSNLLGSDVASLNPCGVAGALSFGFIGKILKPVYKASSAYCFKVGPALVAGFAAPRSPAAKDGSASVLGVVGATSGSGSTTSVTASGSACFVGSIS